MAKKQRQCLIGLDIGGTKLMTVVVDEKFKVLGRFRMKTRGKGKARKGGSLFDRVVECVDGAMKETKIGPKELLGIGVGSPGPLDPKTGVIIDTPNIGWKNFPLADKLSSRFKAPVAVDNDVNLGTYGEFHFGAARGGRHVLGVFPGTGIGGGILIDGRIHHGASGAAGEIGHVVFDPEGPLCGCGQRGCLEAYAGRLPIAGQLAGLVIRGQARHLAEEAGSDLRDIRSSQIAAAIAGGDKMVEQIVRREAARIGLAAVNVVNVLSPDTVVLGGGMVEAMPRLYVEEVSRAIKENALPFLAKFVTVVATKLGDDAVAMGAAKLVAERLAENQKNGKNTRNAKKK
ncbi:MAG: ROK family protein [Phycisphaerae bacterium]|nr:ROK family protein [Phycisphaerae bacterium]